MQILKHVAICADNNAVDNKTRQRFEDYEIKINELNQLNDDYNSDILELEDMIEKERVVSAKKIKENEDKLRTVVRTYEEKLNVKL